VDLLQDRLQSQNDDDDDDDSRFHHRTCTFS
jgi:hypothetical protein